ncbi:CASP-like protein 1E1 [Carya illinoinensis]|uniref:CASP-like protein n=1 Tax=Carya illinoinensis TaxID=32201 RepID=A0A8T1RPJ4_CARIL|nr:CASP-like protein 1E1 [Carya illinoinensis]KAG6668173.1 hypothetical protein CIPAW_01G152500 [Carya illinoinensis]
MEGLERTIASNGNYMLKVEVPRQRTVDLLLRLLALALTLVSAIIIGLSKQTKVVRVVVVASLPPLYVPVPARWHYISAFVYFLVANVIACSYSTLSLVLLLITRKRAGDNMMSILHSMILVLDILMVALLFSCNGASMAIGIIGYRGNTHLRWQKICNLFERFCGQVAASIAVSVAGALMFILMVAFSGLRLRNKSRS